MQIIRGKIGGALKTVIYGPEGIGKSTFASMFPNPVFIDTEGSTKHMDVARTPKPSSWEMLLEQVRYFKNNPEEFSTLIIDTADWAEQLCINQICSKAKKDGIEDFGYGKGYVFLAEEFGRLLNLLNELIEAGINVTITAHAKMRKFEQPDEMGAYDRWEMKLGKNTAPLLKEWADLVLFANYKTFTITTDNKKTKAQGGDRVMYTTHHPCWDAKNRFGLNNELKFDFTEITHLFVPVPKKADTNFDIPSQESTMNKPEPKPAVNSEPDKKPEQQKALQNNIPGIPKALSDLMATNQVTESEIQSAVSSRGYYPENTPISKYDRDFINGVLVGAWSQVHNMIIKKRQDDVDTDIFIGGNI